MFVVALPKAKLPYEATINAGFASDLLALFTASPVMLPTAPGNGPSAAGEDTEDWADLDLGSHDSHVITPSRSKQTSANPSGSEPDFLPELATILRPEELTRQPPYIMVVRQEGRTRVVVQASHAPSLVCLDEYLRRWCRGEVGRVDRVSAPV